MDIQMQTTASASSTAAANGANGSKLVANVADVMKGGQGGFMTTLNAFMTGSGQQAELGSISMPELIQLISAVLPNVQQAPADQQGGIKQLVEGLNQLLKALGDNSDQADQLVSSDAMQQLLAQIQAFLLTMPQIQPDETAHADTEAGDEDGLLALDPLQSDAQAALEPLDDSLFVPLHQTVAATGKPAEGQHATAANGKTFQLQDAKELLTVLAAVLPFAADGEEVAKLTATVQKVLADIHSGGKQAFVMNPSTDAGTDASSKEAEPVVTATSVKSKLDLLAAKSYFSSAMLKPASGSELGSSDVKPLQDDASLTPATPVHDFLKATNPKDDTIKLPAQPVPVQRFAEEMSQFVVKNMRVTLANGMSEAKISLAPEHLGHVDIKITIHNGQVIAQFMADSAAGKEMLENQLSQLRTSLQSQGITVDKLEVTQNQSLQSGMFQDPRQQQSGQQSNRQTKNGKSNDGFEVTGEEAAKDSSAGLAGEEESGSIDVTA